MRRSVRQRVAEWPAQWIIGLLAVAVVPWLVVWLAPIRIVVNIKGLGPLLGWLLLTLGAFALLVLLPLAALLAAGVWATRRKNPPPSIAGAKVISWSIRTATPSDAQQLADFSARLFRQAYEATHPEPTLSEYVAGSFGVARVTQTLGDPASTILVMVADDGSWIGYAEMHQGKPTAPTTVLTRALPGVAPMEIVRFYVDQRAHGQGFAQELMHACEQHARKNNCDALWLQAWTHARRALRFYAKAGFEIHGTAVFIFGERADEDLILARALPQSSSQ